MLLLIEVTDFLSKHQKLLQVCVEDLLESTFGFLPKLQHILSQQTECECGSRTEKCMYILLAPQERNLIVDVSNVGSEAALPGSSQQSPARSSHSPPIATNSSCTTRNPKFDSTRRFARRIASSSIFRFGQSTPPVIPSRPIATRLCNHSSAATSENFQDPERTLPSNIILERYAIHYLCTLAQTN